MNLGDSEFVKDVKISTYLNETQKESLVHLHAEYNDVFVWEVGDMQGLSTDVVSHKLPINPGFELVKQKTRKFKPELSLKTMGKESVTFSRRSTPLLRRRSTQLAFAMRNQGRCCRIVLPRQS